jgi:hypothetical protein
MISAGRQGYRPEGPSALAISSESSFPLQLLQPSRLSWVEQPRDSFQVSTHFKGMFTTLLSLYLFPTAMIKPHLFNQSVNPLRLRSLTTEKCYALYEHASSTPLHHTHKHLFATHADYVVKP